MKINEPKILCILHIPPPINGAAMVGQFIKDSHIINTRFKVDYINLTTSFDLNAIGKGGLGKLVTVLKIQAKVIKALLANNYDLCYMTLTAKGAGFYKDFLIVLVLKLFGKNIIYHFHNKGVKANSNSFINRLLYRFAFKNTKSIMLSPSLYYDIADYVDKEDVYFCPNGMPEIKVANKPESPQISDITYVPSRFLFLSNMMEEKGVYVLLKACQELNTRGIDFQCHFIGAWSDISENDFSDRVGEYHLEDKIFAHGKKYNEDKFEFFQNTDVFVFPTYYNNECFPLVLIEAMQFSLPIVSTPEGAIEDMVVNGETGFLVPQKDYLALADKLATLISNKALLRDMGKAGYRRYQNSFKLQDFETNLSKIFESAVNKT